MRRIFLLHQKIGLFLAFLIGFIAFSGALALLSGDIDRLINPTYYERVSASEQLVDMKQVVEDLIKKNPDREFSEILLKGDKYSPWNIRFVANGLPQNSNGETLEIFIDPLTGDVLGERVYEKTLMFFFKRVHTTLLEQRYGRDALSVIGLLFSIIVITGLLSLPSFINSIWGIFRIRKSHPRLKHADIHKLLGVVALMFLLGFSLTGAWFGFRHYLGVEKPDAHTSATLLQSEGFSADWEKVIDNVNRLDPSTQVEVMKPVDNGQPIILVEGSKKGSFYERGVNKFTYTADKIMFANKFSLDNLSSSDRLYFLPKGLHFGQYGGFSVRILYAIAGVLMCLLAISSYAISQFKRERDNSPEERMHKVKMRVLKTVLATIFFLGATYASMQCFGAVQVLEVVSVLVYVLLLFFLISWGVSLVRRLKER